MSDEILLAGMAGGDQDAAAAFVRRYQARVYGLALTVVRSPALAEEVAQEAFIKAWRHASSYDPRRGRVATWLLTITRNAAVDAVRYGHESPMDPDLLLALLSRRDDLPPEHDVEGVMMLREALVDLPAEQSRPIVLMAFQGMTAQEIAVQQHIPLGTVKTRVRRGLRRLGDKLVVRDG
ncbi:MAG TPA: sigma-70 family RNA polymerase sigma factor [Nocardioides sp.]|nr:sigma-70 family RNA polymerase sigma factor [Nocardioides sp.]